MRQLGVMVRDFSKHELAMRLADEAVRWNTAGDSVAFFVEAAARSSDDPPAPLYPTMSMWGFHGAVVATSLSGAKKLLEAPGPGAKFLYVWEFEWMRMTETPWRALHAIYGDPRLRLVGRTPHHAHLLNQLWGRRDTVHLELPDFDAFHAMAGLSV